MTMNCDLEDGEIIDIECVPATVSTTGNSPVEVAEVQGSICNKEIDLSDTENAECEDVLNACVVCHSQAKYRCPACDLQTCSLLCCKKHKIDNKCDGSIKRSRFIPMSKFDNLAMLNDVRFLEEADRLRRVCRSKNQTLRPGKLIEDKKRLNTLANQCRKAGCQLRFLPAYFEKSRVNTSNYDPIADTIFWKIRIMFSDADSLTVEADRIPETVKIATIVKQIVHPRPNSDYLVHEKKLAFYRAMVPSNLKCFVKVEDNGWTNDLRFYQLDLQSTIKDNLRGKIVLEFPCIYVTARNETANNFKLLTDQVKSEALDKRLWERTPQNRTLEDKLKIIQEAAKRAPRLPVDSAPQDGEREFDAKLVDSKEITSGLKPLRRIIPVRKRRTESERTSAINLAKSTKLSKFGDKEFRFQKRDMIQRLAETLSQTNKKENVERSFDKARSPPSVERTAEKPVEVIIDTSIIDQNKNTDVIVQTSFFGTLGDSRLCPYSSSDNSSDSE